VSLPRIFSKFLSKITFSGAILTIVRGDGTSFTINLGSLISDSAEKDGIGQNIAATYIKSLSKTDNVITFTYGNGKQGTIVMANSVDISYVQGLSSGTLVGTLTIDGVAHKLYCTTVENASTSKKGIVQLSSSTSSTSETEAATSKAVKTAYDLASTAKSAADAAKTAADAAKAASGVADATTSQKGIVQLSSATNSTSETLAATPKAVKTSYDLANTANTTATEAKTLATEAKTLAQSATEASGNIDLSGYMPKSGGTFTGGVFEQSVSMSGTAIEVNKGAVFTKTISANTTFSISGVPSGKAATFSLILTNGGSKTVTWPSSVKWAGGNAPALTASGKDILTFLTGDGGSTWYGVVSSIGAA